MMRRAKASMETVQLLGADHGAIAMLNYGSSLLGTMARHETFLPESGQGGSQDLLLSLIFPVVPGPSIRQFLRSDEIASIAAVNQCASICVRKYRASYQDLSISALIQEGFSESLIRQCSDSGMYLGNLYLAYLAMKKLRAHSVSGLRHFKMASEFNLRSQLDVLCLIAMGGHPDFFKDYLRRNEISLAQFSIEDLKNIVIYGSLNFDFRMHAAIKAEIDQLPATLPFFVEYKKTRRCIIGSWLFVGLLLVSGIAVMAAKKPIFLVLLSVLPISFCLVKLATGGRPIITFDFNAPMSSRFIEHNYFGNNPRRSLRELISYCFHAQLAIPDAAIDICAKGETRVGHLYRHSLPRGLWQFLGGEPADLLLSEENETATEEPSHLAEP